MNLFESFKNIVDQDFINKIKPNLGDTLGDFDVAIDGIYYTLVAGLIRRTNSDMSAGMLFNQIQEKYRQSNLPDDFNSGNIKSDVFKKVCDDGSKIISQIFPAYKSPLISMISTYAGTSKNNTVAFTGMTASVLIDQLGKKIQNEKMTKEDLVHFIKQHHEPLYKAAPDSLMEKMIPALGLQELNTMKYNPNVKKVDSAKVAEESVVEKIKSSSFNDDNSTEEGSLISKKTLIGLITAAVIGAIAFYIYANKDNIGFLNPKPEEPETELVDEALLVPAVDSLAKAKSDSLALAQADSIKNQNPNDIAGLTTYLASTEVAGKEFDFNSIQFVPKSFEIKAETIAVVDELAALMKTNKGMQIKILGFDADAKLANKRAFAVKRMLQEKGIEDIRIDAGPGGAGGDSPRIKVIVK